MQETAGSEIERWVWRPLPQGCMAFDQVQQRCVVGVGWNWYRPWVYPFYTPAGHQVLREFAFDHPFHNGCFVGMHPVLSEGQASNFWVAPPQRQLNDPMIENLGRVVLDEPPNLWTETEKMGALLKLRWIGRDSQLLLREHRSLRLCPSKRANQLTISSKWTAAVSVELLPTKFAGIGVRLDPALTLAGGARYAVIPDPTDDGVPPRDAQHLVRLGCTAKDQPIELLHGGIHDGVRIQAGVKPGWGVIAHQTAPTAPWFVRDYGLVLHNPIQHNTVRLEAGQTMAWSVTITAYDATD